MSAADQINSGDRYVNKENNWTVFEVTDVTNGWVRYRYIEADARGLHMARTVEDFLNKYKRV